MHASSLCEDINIIWNKYDKLIDDFTCSDINHRVLTQKSQDTVLRLILKIDECEEF